MIRRYFALRCIYCGLREVHKYYPYTHGPVVCPSDAVHILPSQLTAKRCSETKEFMTDKEVEMQRALGLLRNQQDYNILIDQLAAEMRRIDPNRRTITVKFLRDVENNNVFYR